MKQVQQEHSPPPTPSRPSHSTANDTATDADDQTPILDPTPTKTHHPNITLSPILQSHIPPLRHLTARLLQVRYPDTFYTALSDPTGSGAFSRVLLWTDPASASNPTPKPTVIGGLVCRPLSTFQARPQSAVDVIPNALYVQSLVLLEPYRKLGLAGALLDEVCRLAGQDPLWGCQTVCAHVWTENDEGLAWYSARGFRKVEPVVEGYYRQLQPAGAWIVRREIGGAGVIVDALRAGGDGRVTPAISSTPPPSALTMPRSTPRSARPGPTPTSGPSLSFQNARPQTEWNDLPVEMQMARNNLLDLPGSGVSSGASSRSSSTTRKKRDRSYPAAAFGQ